MDSLPGKIPRFFLPLRTEEEVVNHILNPPDNIHYQQNVTKLELELFDVFDGVKSATDLRYKDNLERIRAFKSQFLDKLKSVLDKELFLTRGWLDRLSKNEAMADLLRKRGNEYFVKKNFDMALRAYTLAAMYSPKDSKSLALAFSNRSACFAETNNWNKCLEDIKRFEEIWNRIEEGFTLTGDRVAKRKEKCLEKIKDGDLSDEKQFGNLFELKNPSADLPSLEDFLGVKTDPKKGRGIYNISDKAIEPGTLLIRDDPYSRAYFDPFNFQTNNCSACYKILDGSGIPCGGCVFNLYCSETCATSDCHDNHAKYECKLAPYLFKVLPKTLGSNVNGIHLAFTVLLKLGPKGLLDHYRQVFDKKGQKGSSEDGCSFASYLPIYNLIYHEEVLSEETILAHSKCAVILTEILDFATDYFTCLNLDKLEEKLVKEEFTRRLLLHQFSLGLNANAFGYMNLSKERSDLPEESRLVDEEEEGSVCVLVGGIYPVVSLINHSCAPNAKWFPLPSGIVAVFALEHIVPGQEIFVNYQGHYGTEPKDKRREVLRRAAFFNCECTACTENWPMEMNLKPAFEQPRFPFICPDCRMKVEVFDKIRLKRVPSNKQLFACPKRCGYKINQDDLAKPYSAFWKLLLDSNRSVGDGEILKSFEDAKKCAQYFDAHLAKPCKELRMSEGVLQQKLEVIARKMLE